MVHPHNRTLFSLTNQGANDALSEVDGSQGPYAVSLQ